MSSHSFLGTVLIDSIARVLSHMDSSADRPPQYRTATRWLLAGFRRYPRAVAAALLSAWTGLLWALWLVAGAALGGAIVALLAAWHLPLPVGTEQGAGMAAIVVGALAGALAGLGFAFGGSIAQASIQIPIELLTGTILALMISVVWFLIEPWLAELRGERPLSTREAERILPLLACATEAMGLDQAPAIRVLHSPLPGATARPRSIVLNDGGGLHAEASVWSDAELIGVLCHELEHWQRGEPIAQVFVAACAWPVILLYNLATWLAGCRIALVGLVGWTILWPSWVLIHLLIVPVLGRDMRRQEYAADAAAARAGYGDGLQSALAQVAAVEPWGTGWQQVLAATHPPIELRLDALAQGRCGPPVPPPISRVHRRVAERLVRIVAVAVAVALLLLGGGAGVGALRSVLVHAAEAVVAPSPLPTSPVMPTTATVVPTTAISTVAASLPVTTAPPPATVVPTPTSAAPAASPSPHAGTGSPHHRRVAARLIGTWLMLTYNGREVAAPWKVRFGAHGTMTERTPYGVAHEMYALSGSSTMYCHDPRTGRVWTDTYALKGNVLTLTSGSSTDVWVRA